MKSGDFSSQCVRGSLRHRDLNIQKMKLRERRIRSEIPIAQPPHVNSRVASGPERPKGRQPSNSSCESPEINHQGAARSEGNEYPSESEDHAGLGVELIEVAGLAFSFPFHLSEDQGQGPGVLRAHERTLAPPTDMKVSAQVRR